jgi:hypothetical protein
LFIRLFVVVGIVDLGHAGEDLEMFFRHLVPLSTRGDERGDERGNARRKGEKTGERILIVSRL